MANFNTSRNVIVGAAAVYISRKDSLSVSWNPDDPTVVPVPAGTSGVSLINTLDTDSQNTSGTWRNVGYTTNGVEVTYTPTYGEVEVDQLLDTAKMFKEKMTAMVKTELRESTLENMLLVWAQSKSDFEGLPGSGTYKTYSDDGSGTNTSHKGFDNVTLADGDEHLGIAAGALGLDPVERQLLFVGPSPRAVTTNKKRERVYHLRRVLSVSATTHGLKRSDATSLPVEFRLLPANVSGSEYGSIRDRIITTS